MEKDFSPCMLISLKWNYCTVRLDSIKRKVTAVGISKCRPNVFSSRGDHNFFKGQGLSFLELLLQTTLLYVEQFV